ncbi:MAG: hypothetical protein WDO24_23935 [Pseudomonadota bacterium]
MGYGIAGSTTHGRYNGQDHDARGGRRVSRPGGLNGAISDLTGAGIDRAEMSLLAQEGILDGEPAQAYRTTRQAADDPTTARQAIYADTDIRQGRTLLTSMASAIAALAASGAVVLTGGAALAALAAALGAGGGVGAIGRHGRQARRRRATETFRSADGPRGHPAVGQDHRPDPGTPECARSSSATRPPTSMS